MNQTLEEMLFSTNDEDIMLAIIIAYKTGDELLTEEFMLKYVYESSNGMRPLGAMASTMYVMYKMIQDRKGDKELRRKLQHITAFYLKIDEKQLLEYKAKSLTK